MKVLHVITNFSASGGAEAMLARYAAHSAAQHRVIALLAADSSRYPGGEALAGRCESLRIDTVAGLAAAAWRLRAAARRERPDVVLAWMYHAQAFTALAKRAGLLGMPLAWTTRQSLDARSTLTRSTRVALAITRALSSSAELVIYNAERARDQHVAYGIDRPSLVIPNGVVIPPSRPRRGGSLTIGTVGRFHPQKDHATFAAVAARLRARYPGLGVHMAGRGLTPDNRAVTAMLRRAGLDPASIDLLGDVTDMNGFYRSIDLLVQTSRTEGFPNAVIEAMSHGVVPVATDVGDTRLAIGDDTLVARAGDDARLAAIAARIIELDRASRAALAAKLHDRVIDRFAIGTISARYDDALAGLMGDRR